MKIILATGQADFNESLFSFLQKEFDILGRPESREDCLALLRYQPDLAIISSQLPGTTDLVEMLYVMRLEEIRIIFLAPTFDPSDPTLKTILDLGIYDFIPGSVTIGSILEKLYQPTGFKDAVNLLHVGLQTDPAKIVYSGWPPRFSGVDRTKGGCLITVSSACAAGKTMVAVNIAAMLADYGNSVALVDLDIKNLAVHSWLKCPAGDAALVEVFQNQQDFSSAEDILNFFYRPKEVSGLWVLSAELAESHPNIKEKALHNFLNRLAKEVNFIVLDTDGDLDNPITRTALDKSFWNFVITTQDYHHLHLNKEYMVNIKPHNCSVILNRHVESQFLSVNDVEQVLTWPVEFKLPDLTPVIFESIKGGVPAILLDPDLKKVFREISNLIFYGERRIS